MDQDNIKLLGAFASYDQCRTMIQALLQNTNSASVTLLALEGLSRIEQDVHFDQFCYDVKEKIRGFLRKWRCESLDREYTTLHRKILRRLTIFETLEVPLFIDEYGTKRLMKQFKFNGVKPIDVTLYSTDVQQWLENVAPETLDVEPIPIVLDTPIVHVTHTLQKDQIVEMNRFNPSNKKNIIAGLWFSPRYKPPNQLTSRYGNWAFETTLRKLGVSEIRQGEIVSYKQEVNFIVYASDTDPQSLVVKATENAAKLSQNRLDAYTAVSIFVPWRFLPQSGPPTLAAFGQPYQVSHEPFCVQVKRGELEECPDLS